MSQDSSSTPPPLPDTPMTVEYQTHTAEPNRRAAKTSMLHWLGIVPALIFVAFVFRFKIPEAMRNTANSSGIPAYLVGWMIGGFLFSLIPAWIVWFFSRNRMASTITFSVIMLLMCLVTVSSSLPHNNVGQQATAAVQAAAQPVLKKRLAMDAAMKTINDAKAISTLGSKDQAGLDQSLNLLDAGIAANDELRASIETSRTAIAQELSSRGVSSAQRQATVAQFNKEMTDAESRNESQVRLLRAGRAMTAFLRDHFGDWQYDSKELKYVYKTDDEVNAFADLQKELADAARAVKQAPDSTTAQ